MKLKVLTLVLFLACLPQDAFPIHVSELYLYKRDPNLYGICGRCATEYVLEGHQDRLDISDYMSFNQTGYYHMTMYGPPAIVTLFAREDYDISGGFLIVVKKDNKPVVIPELDVYPHNKWTTIEPENSQTGVFDVFYSPHKFFKNDITSVRWKKWWDQLPSPVGN